MPETIEENPLNLIRDELKRFDKDNTEGKMSLGWLKDSLTCIEDYRDPSQVNFITYDYDITVSPDSTLETLRTLPNGARQPLILKKLKLIPGAIIRDRKCTSN